MVLIEVCADCVESVTNAHRGGARRVELCAGLIDGGVTPSAGMISVACETAAALDPPIPIHVLIRPRGGDFVFSEAEVQTMVVDIKTAASLGAAGVVLGCLNVDGTIDVAASAKLIAIAREAALKVTFHRAVDMAPDVLAAFDQVLGLGVDWVLTSGGENTAVQGASTIAEMIIINLLEEH